MSCSGGRGVHTPGTTIEFLSLSAPREEGMKVAGEQTPWYRGGWEDISESPDVTLRERSESLYKEEEERWPDAVEVPGRWSWVSLKE